MEVRNDNNEQECPKCPECESTETEYLGIIAYGADYDRNSEWYEDCQFLPGWHCSNCDCDFVVHELTSIL